MSWSPGKYCYYSVKRFKSPCLTVRAEAKQGHYHWQSSGNLLLLSLYEDRTRGSVSLLSSHLIPPSTYSFLLQLPSSVSYPTTFCFSLTHYCLPTLLQSFSVSLSHSIISPSVPYYAIFPLSSRCDSHDSLVLQICLAQIGLCESISFFLYSLLYSFLLCVSPPFFVLYIPLYLFCVLSVFM